MKKFEQLWIMPPLYHRVYEYLTRTTTEPKQVYGFQEMARFVGWYDEESWEQPNEAKIKKILAWLDEHQFIRLESGDYPHVCRVTVTWKQMHITKPVTQKEYFQTYLSMVTDTYKGIFRENPYETTNEDIQAIYELSAQYIPIQKVTEIMNECSLKNITPSVGYIRDLVFADICYQMTCRS